jgi:hypothetical protein
MKTSNVIFHPTTNEELNALKAIGKALRLKFEITKAEHTYNSEFVKKIKRGEQDILDGKGITVNMDDLNKLWK